MVVVVIPARMGASRFPGKPLASLLGKPMLEHVYRRSLLSEAVDDVLIATCDDEIRRACESFGAEVVMTSPDHERASDRVAEVAADLNAETVVMVQGDEPMTHPGMIDQAIAPMSEDPNVECVNLMAAIGPDGLADPNTIKVVTDESGRALYFSRNPIPWRDGDQSGFKQVCVIPFQRRFLLEYAAMSPTALEAAEKVDMLRILEHGRSVHMVETQYKTQAVDTPEDLVRVEQLMRSDPLAESY